MKKYKGLILAGGAGTRLYPMTSLFSKQLINIYDKPMIYYPLSLLMLVDIRDIIIIADEPTLLLYQKLFNDGSKLGLDIKYVVQAEPKGIAQAFPLSRKYIEGHNTVLILGDNLFYGDTDFLRIPLQNHNIATIFAYYVNNASEYGVVEFNKNGVAISLEEKPKCPKSNYAVPGLYIYDKSILDVVDDLKPSPRGELEITHVNNFYLWKQTLRVNKIGRGIAWLDTGTPQSLADANQFISSIENRQGLKVGCIEEIALKKNYIDYSQFTKILESTPESQYKTYLKRILYD